MRTFLRYCKTNAPETFSCCNSIRDNRLPSSWTAQSGVCEAVLPNLHRQQTCISTNLNSMDPSREATDRAMMSRCIELSRIAVSEGEHPFGTVIALDGRIVAEAINRNIQDGDVTHHAEVIALSGVQKAINREQLRRCTNVKPRAMCSYCIREAWVGRVVYAIGSPAMGGLSKWNILRDDGISDIPQIFGAVPEVVSGVLLHQAQRVWRDWNQLAWHMVKLRGLLTEASTNGAHIHARPAHGRSLWHYLQMLLVRTRQPRIKTEPPDVSL
jgi:tRNA(adenine34) deaminase